MNALLDVDVELEIRKIDVGILDVKVTPMDLTALWFLFEQKDA